MGKGKPEWRIEETKDAWLVYHQGRHVQSFDDDIDAKAHVRRKGGQRTRVTIEEFDGYSYTAMV